MPTPELDPYAGQYSTQGSQDPANCFHLGDLFFNGSYSIIMAPERLQIHFTSLDTFTPVHTEDLDCFDRLANPLQVLLYPSLE